MHVYFVQSGRRGSIKIGSAINVERRMTTLQTGNPDRLRLLAVIKCKTRGDAMVLEKKLHKKFKRHRLRGEWYKSHIKLADIREDLIDERPQIFDPKTKTITDPKTVDWAK